MYGNGIDDPFQNFEAGPFIAGDGSHPQCDHIELAIRSKAGGTDVEMQTELLHDTVDSLVFIALGHALIEFEPDNNASHVHEEASLGSGRREKDRSAR